jgi:hypothetical protein
VEEFEAKFLSVDPAQIERKVLVLGGRRVFDRLSDIAECRFD